MPPLNPEFGRRLAALLRDYLRQQADIQSLASILNLAETEERPPYGWLEALNLMRKTSEYKRIAEEYEQAFVAMETRSDQLEIEQLLASMPSTHYPN